MTNEKRRSPRICPQVETYARIKSVLPARILDISLHGVQLEVSQSLQRRAEYRFSLPTPGGDLLLRAAVRRCSLTGLRKATPVERAALVPKPKEGENVAIYRAGLEFVELQPEQLDGLQRFCASLQNKSELQLHAMA